MTKGLLENWQIENNVSNEKLADLADVDVSYISHIKKGLRQGKRRCSPELAIRIEHITGGAVNHDYLLFPPLSI